MKKILVVDDSPTARMHLTTLLDSKGYHISTASDGEEAIQ